MPTRKPSSKKPPKPTTKDEVHVSGESTVTAQVIVRSKSGAVVRGDMPITSGNISQYLPSSADAQAAQEGFRALGFDTGPIVGISFAITAAPNLFERVFGVHLAVKGPGLVERAG